ncbi:MAG: hypothetical protein FWH05_00375 [Oscillospiraceae bacterium]|nr:hypothetical protein [Oscillospiraceae bacterium]
MLKNTLKLRFVATVCAFAMLFTVACDSENANVNSEPAIQTEQTPSVQVESFTESPAQSDVGGFPVSTKESVHPVLEENL